MEDRTDGHFWLSVTVTDIRHIPRPLFPREIVGHRLRCIVEIHKVGFVIDLVETYFVAAVLF